MGEIRIQVVDEIGVSCEPCGAHTALDVETRRITIRQRYRQRRGPAEPARDVATPDVVSLKRHGHRDARTLQEHEVEHAQLRGKDRPSEVEVHDILSKRGRKQTEPPRLEPEPTAVTSAQHDVRAVAEGVPVEHDADAVGAQLPLGAGEALRVAADRARHVEHSEGPAHLQSRR